MTEQPPTYAQPPAAPPQPKNGLGTAALVLGIVGAALAWIPVIGFMGFVCGILAVVFGAIGWNRTRKGAATNKGASIAGLVLGIVSIVLSSVVWVGTLDAVDDSLDELDDSLTCIEEADTEAEIEACE